MPTALPATTTPPAPPSEAVLERNLTRIARVRADLAERIRSAPEREGLEWFVAPDGALGAKLDGRLLCSARRPLAEAATFADQIDAKESPGVGVAGFGLGHHVAAVASKIGFTGLVIVYEPDLPLLRAVLSRIDCTPWLATCNLLILDDPEDAASVHDGVRRMESLLAMGVRLATHLPSQQRLGERADRFGRTITRVVSAIRTSVVTTMVQMEATARNVLMNADWVAGRPGVEPLRGICAGRPAVVVSAGPSLARNIALLSRPGVRDKVVIIAVQTALKPLLAAGVRPHFVTALDFHEISRRFYEGLTAADVEGVTLVAEPKANPAIIESFPGAVRCPRDEFLEIALGADISLAEERGRLPLGSTVAHLSYYLARFLGADPVALIGQDLGFTDGQYYAAGAAIHQVWAGELNEFNSLELLEWERIVRARGILRRVKDHLGRPVYTDEQMATYLAQFERDFKADEASGLSTIDCTEGGVAKAHTSRMSLATFLHTHAGETAPDLPVMPSADRIKRPESIQAAAARLREVRGQVWRVAELSRRGLPLLDAMLESRHDQRRVNSLIESIYGLRDEAKSLGAGYELCQRFNQTGAFNRTRDDRTLHLEEDLTPEERQARQIRRDRKNLEWLASSSDALGEIMDRAIRALEGGPKVTRDPKSPEPSESAPKGSREATIAALVTARMGRTPLGIERPLDAPLHGGTVLRATLERLGASGRIRRAIVLTDDAARCERAIGGRVPGLEVEIAAAPAREFESREAGLRGARLWASRCWRGGLGGLTCYDEALLPDAMATALEARGVTAGLVVGGDWCAIDPSLADAVVERWSEDPDTLRLCFTQAAPGLAGCVVDARLLRDFAASGSDAGAFSSIGGLIGYMPLRPAADPIVMPVCVPIDIAARDAGERCIADTGPMRARLERALRGGSADTAEVVRALRADEPPAGPGHLLVELTTERSLGGARLRWARGGAESLANDRGPMSLETLERALAPFLSARPDVLVTFGGAGDPVLHPDLGGAVALARRLGAAGVHIRTDLLAPMERIEPLIAISADVISVDLLSWEAPPYSMLTDTARFNEARENLMRLMALQRTDGWLPTPWLVPRMTRCDAVYEDVEPFIDNWLLRCGWAALDPMPAPPPRWAPEGERIAPLPLPRSAHRSRDLDRALVLADGSFCDDLDTAGASAVGNVLRDDALALWRRLLERRGVAQ